MSKYIRQIKLMGNKNYFPNKYYSPYEFLHKLNEALKGRYEIQIIEVKYFIREKISKEFDSYTTFKNFQEDPNFNNVFSLDNDFMKDYILGDAKLLEPPKDFDPNEFDEQNEMARKMEEDRKMDEVDKAIKLIMAVLDKNADVDLRSIASFKQTLSKQLADGEADVFVKVIITAPVEERIQEEKHSKNPVIVQSQGKQEIRVHLHPIKFPPESIEFYNNLTSISNWGLGCKYSGESYNYFNIDDIGRLAEKINISVKIQNYLNLHKNKKGNLDSIELYSFMFNQIVLKIVVNIAQIFKIQKCNKEVHGEEDSFFEYYLHLTYPPKFYISILKSDVASDINFIRSWERVQNFTFLRNEVIFRNQFLRLFLFNNTILRIKMQKNDFKYLDEGLKRSKERIDQIIDQFKGSIQFEQAPLPLKFNKNIKSMRSQFPFQKMNKQMLLSISIKTLQSKHKLWKLQYLILVIVRLNKINPKDLRNLIDKIMNSKEEIDLFIYILWKASTNMELGQQKEDFMTYFDRQLQETKKLNTHHIIKKQTNNTDFIAHIFKVSLTPSGYLYNPATPQMKGRLLKQYSNQSQYFIRVNIHDDNQSSLKNQKYVTKKAFRKMMEEVKIVQRSYIPLGWSPSQLRGYSLWYIHQFQTDSKEQKGVSRQQILSFLGDFDKIDIPAKKAARIGQSFSASWTYICKDNQITQNHIDDELSSKGYLYTDGIGKISKNLIQKISLKLEIKELSVLQIRYKGAKGILVLDNNLKSNNISLRPSMIKYECNHSAAQKYLDVLDWNKFKSGFLNRQIIILLKTLGIKDKVFSDLQEEHIKQISNLTFKDCSIFKHMNQEMNTDLSNLEPANQTILNLVRAGFTLEEQPFFRGVLETMKKNGYNQLKVKSNILVKNSARIIGIIDQYKILEQGELYCTIYDPFADKPRRQTVEGSVIITRNPCLHPGDIRKLKCISNTEIQNRFKAKGFKHNYFREIVNCIIFPMKGQIPVTAQISGSDLDGDNFFICWQEKLIPQHVQEPHIIDQAQSVVVIPKKKDKKKVQYCDMLDFFIDYLNYEKLGQIDNSHLVKADEGEKNFVYAKSKDCIQLAIIHGKAVDFPKSGYCPPVDLKLLVSKYPDFMEKQQNPQYQSDSILGKLYRSIKQKIQDLLLDNESQKKGIELNQDLLYTQMMEYDPQEIHYTMKILKSYDRDLHNLINLVGVDTQYEIYSGNFSIAKEKVKLFGKNRLLASILTLRSRYFDEFFSELPTDDKDQYYKCEGDLEKVQLFTAETRRKAVLYYITSYIMKYPDIKFDHNDNFKKIKNIVQEKFKEISIEKETKFCGFVWFILPKIITNIKYRSMKMTKEIKKVEHKQKEEGGDEEEKENIQHNNYEEDEEQPI